MSGVAGLTAGFGVEEVVDAVGRLGVELIGSSILYLA
jgi:hypothetical protein